MANDQLEAAADTVDDDAIDQAMERANELFEAAPWHATSASEIAGCMHLTMADLFALLVAAERREQERLEAWDIALERNLME